MSETKDIELKPCPFCGSDATFMGGNNPNDLYYWVDCTNVELCGAEIPGRTTKEKAAKLWNRRSNET